MGPDHLERLRQSLAERYHFDRELGQGAFAIVFLAHDLRHERLVAIKVLRVEPGTELNQIRFHQEIRLLAGLQHPNIVPVHDSGHVAELLYYVMPYVRGETLRERIHRERRLDLTDAVRITSEIADALAYAHRQGVIHRDIKPENVLLSESHAMLADFGIARAIYSSRVQRITNPSSGSPGTPAYMSPEQILGQQPVDSRSDIYSLGCVLFEELTGKPPFEGPEGFAKRFTGPVPSARLARPEVPPGLDAVVTRALAPKPSERFRDASEMCEALSQVETGNRVVSSDGAEVHPVPNKREPVLWTWRWWIAAAAAAAILTVVAAPPVVGFLARPAANASHSDARRIAVLDFEDQSPDHTLGHIASGLAVSLIHELADVPAIQVVSRNSIKSLHDRGFGLDSLVRTLGIGSLVEGSVQSSGDRLRVRIQVVDALSNTQLQSATLERPMGELFMLEDDVAHGVAVILRRQLGVQVRVRETIAGTTNARARELVFRADKLRDDASKALDAADTAEATNAVELLHAADSVLALAENADRRWLAPVVDRGWVALDLAQHLSGAARAENFQRAIDNADRALDRDSANVSALELRGTALYWQAARLDLNDSEFSRRLGSAKGSLEAALSKDSSLATAWGTLSLVLTARGEAVAATRAARTAMSMDTYLKDGPSILLALYATNLMKGSFQDAFKWCEQGARDYPADARFMECKLTLLAEDQSRPPDPRAAWALIERANTVDPPAHAKATGRDFLPIYRQMMGAIVLARAGQIDSARAVAKRVEEVLPPHSELHTDFIYDKAYLHLILGERSEAVRLLSEYLVARPSLRGLVSKHPRWQPLWKEPAFIRIIQPTKPG